ncbi:D-alanyl-D-alanine carboxypeptidase-like protein [Tamaricihabitans halophyticus]|uniref:D-alanyl-D-alanine carboxypeptidase-like protein n=1 Tax=Tamaricihabitans halophyticus TaxID=1262583 RepID=A0A4R2QIJ6_9PSEU|nr:M15 family metallopeptidase [Tamaricihabitans halophyticus]TCP49180.1 D-alanyl-D-alanine carboxypeptidase-like protein [Tamaricihabitans halophyticus]
MPRRGFAHTLLIAVCMVLTVAACANPGPPVSPSDPTRNGDTPRSTSDTTVTTPEPSPSWRVGASPLPRRPDGLGEIQPTPPELTERRLPTNDVLAPPEDGRYAARIQRVPDQVLARSTWSTGCPVGRAQLRYLTMSFWGFDGRPHTGEMLVHERVANQLTEVFQRLYAARFPIEEMRVVRASELDAPPTGDGNNTTAFVCRPTTGEQGWSAHAYGLAIDLNPFQNPYTSSDIVLPELASSYVDRTWRRPGMLRAGDAAVSAFQRIAWTWGAIWRDPRDIMHFSATGN